MMGKDRDWKHNKLVILLLLTGAVYFFLRFLTPLLGPALLAMLFVTMFGSFLQKMQAKLGIHRQIGAVLLLLVACVVVAGLLTVFLTWIVGSLPRMLGNLELVENRMTDLIHTLCQIIDSALGVDREYLESTFQTAFGEWVEQLQLKLVPGMMSQSWQYVKILGGIGGFVLTFLISTVLMAKDYDDIMNRMLDREEFHVVLEVICGIIRYLATFIKAQLVIMGVISMLAGSVLGILRIPHGVLWGILAGFLDVLPFVGTGVVLVPTAIVQLTGGHYVRAAACILLYIICIFVREMLEPRLIGKRMGVSPIAVLLSLYVGIGLFGLGGIIKGPLGFVIIQRSYLSLQKRNPSIEKR